MCGNRIPLARNRRPAVDKVKYLEPMFGDFDQARTKACKTDDFCNVEPHLSQNAILPAVFKVL